MRIGWKRTDLRGCALSASAASCGGGAGEVECLAQRLRPARSCLTRTIQEGCPRPLRFRQAASHMLKETLASMNTSFSSGTLSFTSSSHRPTKHEPNAFVQGIMDFRQQALFSSFIIRIASAGKLVKEQGTNEFCTVSEIIKIGKCTWRLEENEGLLLPRRPSFTCAATHKH